MRHGDVDPRIIVFCQSIIETMIHPLFYYKFFIYYKYKCWLLSSICQLDTSSLISHFSHVNRREIAGSSITQYAYSCYSYYLDVRLPSHILALPYTFLIVDLEAKHIRQGHQLQRQSNVPATAHYGQFQLRNRQFLDTHR